MRLSYTILYVADVNRSIRFYRQAFNLEHRFTHESGDYAEMETGNTILAFCDSKLAADIIKGEYIQSDPTKPPLGTQLTFEPEDVKQAFENAVEYGAKVITKPEIKPWSFAVAMLRDPDGHLVELARKVEE
ncbi:MAG: VOC family protein [Calditrichota bacterium]